MIFKAILACSALLASFLSNAAPTITACIDEHPPYQLLTEPPSGIHIEALKVLAQQLDRQLIMVESPNFARCVALLKLGRVDVIAGLNKNPERQKFAFYAPYKLEEELVLISKQGVSHNQLDSLSKKIIGVPRGTTYFAKFDNNNRLTKIAIPSVKAGIELVIKDRIDLIITSQLVAKNLIEQTDAAKLKVSVIPREDKEDNLSYFGFSKRNNLGLTQQQVISVTTDAFNQGLFAIASCSNSPCEH